MNHPVWLKVVCIVSIVLGCLGLLMAVTTIVGQLMLEQVQVTTLKWMQAMPAIGMPPKMLELQKDMMGQTTAIQLRWQPVFLALGCLHVFVAAALLAGGVQALRKKPMGRKLLLFAMTAATLFELVRLPPTAGMQWQMSKLMSPFMDRMMEVSTTQQRGPMSPAQRKTVQTITRASMVAGVLLGFLTALGMATFKLAFYGGGIWLLRQPHVVQMYAPPMDAVVAT